MKIRSAALKNSPQETDTAGGKYLLHSTQFQLHRNVFLSSAELWKCNGRSEELLLARTARILIPEIPDGPTRLRSTRQDQIRNETVIPRSIGTAGRTA